MATTRFAGFFFPMFASIARKQVVSRRAPPAPSCAQKSDRCWCKTTFATAADIVSCRVLLVLLIAVRNHCPTRVAPSNARSVMIARRAASHQHAQKFARPNRSSSAGSTICARGQTSVCSNCENTVTRTRNFTIRSKRRCAAFTRSSSSSVSLRHSGFRQSRRSHLFICDQRGSQRSPRRPAP